MSINLGTLLKTAFLLSSQSFVAFQASHHRALLNFVEAQAQYYAQCHAYMTDLQKQLAR